MTDTLTALRLSRSHVAASRQALFDCHVDPVTGRVDDELGVAALAEDDAVLAAIDAALALPAVPQWMPIETAPKDVRLKDGKNTYGPAILVSPGRGANVVRAAWWSHADGSANFLQDGGMACFPTHWMPLPTAPTTPEVPNADA